MVPSELSRHIKILFGRKQTEADGLGRMNNMYCDFVTHSPIRKIQNTGINLLHRTTTVIDKNGTSKLFVLRT